MDETTLITQKINPYILAMTGGMLVENDCPDEITNVVMLQILSQLKKQGVNANEMLTRKETHLPPVTFSIPVGYVTVIGEYCIKAMDTEPGGTQVLVKAWLPFFSEALNLAEADDIKINRGGLEYGTN